jgi:hypothetical protein
MYVFMLIGAINLSFKKNIYGTNYASQIILQRFFVNSLV